MKEKNCWRHIEETYFVNLCSFSITTKFYIYKSWFAIPKKKTSEEIQIQENKSIYS